VKPNYKRRELIFEESHCRLKWENEERISSKNLPETALYEKFCLDERSLPQNEKPSPILINSQTYSILVEKCKPKTDPPFGTFRDVREY